MGTFSFRISAALCGVVAATSASHAGFDYYLTNDSATQSVDLWVLNRGIGGMVGAGVQTGNQLRQVNLSYQGGATSFARDLVFPDPDIDPSPPPVEMVNIANSSNVANKSWIRLPGGNTRVYLADSTPSPDSTQWQSLTQFDATVATFASSAIVPNGGFRVAHFGPNLGSGLVQISGTLQGVDGTPIGFSSSTSPTIIPEFFGFDQRSYVSSFSPPVTTAPQRILNGSVSGFGPPSGTVVGVDLPSFLTVISQNTGGFGSSFGVNLNRALTAADAGIYLAKLRFVDDSGYFNIDTNYTIQVLPEPSSLAAISLGLLAFRRRRS